MRRYNLKIGEKITLLPFEDEPEQEAILLLIEVNGILLVQLLPQYIIEDEDDGLREITVDEIKFDRVCAYLN